MAFEFPVNNIFDGKSIMKTGNGVLPTDALFDGRSKLTYILEIPEIIYAVLTDSLSNLSDTISLESFKRLAVVLTDHLHISDSFSSRIDKFIMFIKNAVKFAINRM